LNGTASIVLAKCDCYDFIFPARKTIKSSENSEMLHEVIGACLLILNEVFTKTVVKGAAALVFAVSFLFHFFIVENYRKKTSCAISL
jgi:hypothetical protein